jgi:hypothetical protein
MQREGTNIQSTGGFWVGGGHCCLVWGGGGGGGANLDEWTDTMVPVLCIFCGYMLHVHCTADNFLGTEVEFYIISAIRSLE